MKKEIIVHASKYVSYLSDTVADKYKSLITDAQYYVLLHNVFTIEKSDELSHKYRGCGCGWVEVDKNGNFIDMQYLDENIVQWVEADFFYSERTGVVRGTNSQNLYLTTGQIEQNIFSLEFDEAQLSPLILSNGNIRFLVNISCYEMFRF